MMDNQTLVLSICPLSHKNCTFAKTLETTQTRLEKSLRADSERKAHFLFDGQYHDQIDGMAMGSSLDPLMANNFTLHCRITRKLLLNQISCKT